MMGVVIVCDSTADLQISAKNKYGIKTVPLKVHFGDEEYRDGVDITAEEFYRKLESSKVLPTTSQPSPGDFVEMYKGILADGDHSIISIHLSAKLSGTHHSAEMAKRMLPDSDIEVIDSKLASTAYGIIVLEAAKAAANGKNKDEIVSLIEDLLDRVSVMFVVDTLEYLKKGGRIGKAQALLGTMLNIKPILTLEAGEIMPLTKARGRKKAISELIQKMQEKIGSEKQTLMGIMHASDPQGAEMVKGEITKVWSPDSMVESMVGPVIGTHTGPGTLAIIGIKRNNETY